MMASGDRSRCAHGDVDHFVFGGDEEQAVLRRDQLVLILLGDAADATSVAARRDGDGALPASEEEVAGGGAGVVERAVGVLLEDTILRLGTQALLNETLEPRGDRSCARPSVSGLSVRTAAT